MSVFHNAKQFLRKKLITDRWKRKIESENFSIFANDCVGGVISHDLSQEFKSPTVNLYMSASDYLRFLEKPKDYLGKNITSAGISESGYPIGKIGDITLNLVHYASIEQAQEKWSERSKKINWDNLYVVMNDRNGMTYEDLVQFDKLPYKNKVCFTHRPYAEIKAAYYIRGFEQAEEVGVMTAFVRKISLHRWFDQFDWAKWFDTGLIR